jgi:rhodanese-related sulfurtransferase
MSNFCNRPTYHQWLALIAVVLGIFAFIAGDPYSGSRITIDTKELASIVEGKVDHVTALELADWIIQEKTDYRLIDLRTKDKYSEYHIPTAECVALPDLMELPLQRTEKIVLDSEGCIHSAQAWMLLAARGFVHSKMLLGGFEAWQDSVLFPTLPENPAPSELAAIEKLKSVSAHFGGAPQTGGQAISEVKRTITAPKITTPTATGKPSGGKKKKEGC